MRVKKFDKELDDKVGKPGKIRMANILAFYHPFTELLTVDWDYVLREEHFCQGDVRITTRDNKFELRIETEARDDDQGYYPLVEAGKGNWRRIHMFSRRLMNTADVFVCFNPCLDRFYSFPMDDFRQMPIDEMTDADDKRGGKEPATYVNVPREYARFFLVNNEEKVVKNVPVTKTTSPYGGKYVPWSNLWVPIGARDKDGRALQRVTLPL